MVLVYLNHAMILLALWPGQSFWHNDDRILKTRQSLSASYVKVQTANGVLYLLLALYKPR